jgi:AcrR family transcriptional regulator
MSNSTPRDRLLETARTLFYVDGVAAVGVGRVIEEAGVGQMSLWRAFGSKQGLIEAWLRDLDAKFLTEMQNAVTANPNPRDRVAALFDVGLHRTTDPLFVGCALVKAAAEPAACGPVARRIAGEHKLAVHAMLLAAAQADRVRRPDELADQLLFLMEGLFATTGLALSPASGRHARSAALTLFDAAVRSGRSAAR